LKLVFAVVIIQTMTEAGSSEQGFVENRGLFKVNSREIMHDRFSMQLIHDQVTRPDGSFGEQYWVNFPRQAVLVYPMDENNNIYLLREFTYGANRYSIEAAGGVINEGETPEDAALRKVREELNVELDKDSLQKLGQFGEITSRVNNISHSYLARVKSVGEPNPNAGDDITRRIMPFETAMAMVRSGEIYTGVIAAALWSINDLINSEAK